MPPFIARQEPFTCKHCQAEVEPLTGGSYRNHCPVCLYSLHVDDKGPGDRAANCGSTMKPVALEQAAKKGWKLLHKCEACKREQWNKCAPDDDMIPLAKKLADEKLRGLR